MVHCVYRRFSDFQALHRDLSACVAPLKPSPFACLAATTGACCVAPHATSASLHQRSSIASISSVLSVDTAASSGHGSTRILAQDEHRAYDRMYAAAKKVLKECDDWLMKPSFWGTRPLHATRSFSLVTHHAHDNRSYRDRRDTQTTTSSAIDASRRNVHTTEQGQRCR